MTKILVVGQNPSFKTKDNATLARLARWMDAAGVRHWSFVNVQSRPGSFIPSSEDRHFLWMCLKDSGQAVVALGTNASRTLERLQIKHRRIEHPSGLNRNLNDPEVEALQPILIREMTNA